jgi:UDP-GlcNAc:undecaprenyl-phosphate GlcNAc-1-phosphate transferase
MSPATLVLSISGVSLLAMVVVAILARYAPALGLVDHPGGRKDHSSPVPAVGGIALAITLLAGEWFLGDALVPPFFLGAAAILVVVSVWDDRRELHHVPRFAGQIAAVLVMVYGAGVVLHSVGNLSGWRPIGMSVFAVPMTVFAVVGVINAVNMIDGMDGLAGSTSLVSLAWYGVAATLSGLQELAGLAWLLCGGLAGFLFFNVRTPWQPRARVFLGDAGSTLLGFALAWLAIDLTQGPSRTMPPIAALWVVLLPLADTVSLMARRRARGKSPFHPDREHIHHFLQARGFTVGQSLLILVGVSALFGAVGVIGWRLGVPEPVLFWTFASLFFAYHYAIKAAWRRQPSRRLVLKAETVTLIG